MNFSEIAASMGGRDNFQLGILAKPDVPAQTGVVVLVGGPQYRAGSHRQFVLLSRALAQEGFAVLRIDYRGMGDSDGMPYKFTNVSPDIARAIDAFQTQELKMGIRLPAFGNDVPALARGDRGSLQGGAGGCQGVDSGGVRREVLRAGVGGAKPWTFRRVSQLRIQPDGKRHG